MAYQLALPPRLSNLHDVFHVSQLRKYIPDPSHIINSKFLEFKTDLSYQSKPLRIIERSVKTLRNKNIPLVKVIWAGLTSEEATWEREEDMRSYYPELF